MGIGNPPYDEFSRQAYTLFQVSFLELTAHQDGRKKIACTGVAAAQMGRRNGHRSFRVVNDQIDQELLIPFFYRDPCNDKCLIFEEIRPILQKAVQLFRIFLSQLFERTHLRICEDAEFRQIGCQEIRLESQMADGLDGSIGKSTVGLAIVA